MEADITAWAIWGLWLTLPPPILKMSMFKPPPKLFSLPSMQCALHQLSGNGVLDGPASHRKGHLWDSDCCFSTCCHRCALQGVVTRHHTDRQPEEVRMRFDSPQYHCRLCSNTNCESIKLYRLLIGLTAQTEHTVFTLSIIWNKPQQMQQLVYVKLRCFVWWCFGPLI